MQNGLRENNNSMRFSRLFVEKEFLFLYINYIKNMPAAVNTCSLIIAIIHVI